MIEFLILMFQQATIFIELKKAIDIMLANPYFRIIAFLTSIPTAIFLIKKIIRNKKFK